MKMLNPHLLTASSLLNFINNMCICMSLYFSVTERKTINLKTPELMMTKLRCQKISLSFPVNLVKSRREQNRKLKLMIFHQV